MLICSMFVCSCNICNWFSDDPKCLECMGLPSLTEEEDLLFYLFNCFIAIKYL